MTTAPTRPYLVLVVDGDARVRAALAELIDSTEGFTVVGTVDSVDGFDRSLLGTDGAAAAAVAVVGLQPATPTIGLGHVRALTTRMPVLAVAASGSLQTAAAAAGAAAFCEMDGNAEALIQALHTASQGSSAAIPSVPTGSPVDGTARPHPIRSPLSNHRLRPTATGQRSRRP
jgi:DNA-binding NarL/FixJ family response regulator